MATWNILVRSARSALKSTHLASRCLPATGSAAWPAIPLCQRLETVASRPFSSKPNGHRTAPTLTVEELTFEEYRKAFELTDDIVNSEAKLHALFVKWISHNEAHFDVEDEKAFKERFEIFKDTARYCNEHNKQGHSTTCGINSYSDMTTEEIGAIFCGSRRRRY